MPQPEGSPDIVRATYVTYGAIILAWLAAWVLRTHAFLHIKWVGTPLGDFTYWTVAKIVIWILPALWLIRLSKRKVEDLFRFSGWKLWLKWGFRVGILYLLLGLITKHEGHRPLVGAPGYGLLNVLVIAPLFEEFLMRGAIMGNLLMGYRFWTANAITAVMFMGLHAPGWYFMGHLGVVIALQVVFVGLVLGFVADRGKSILASMICHFCNNLASF